MTKDRVLIRVFQFELAWLMSKYSSSKRIHGLSGVFTDRSSVSESSQARCAVGPDKVLYTLESVIDHRIVHKTNSKCQTSNQPRCSRRSAMCATL